MLQDNPQYPYEVQFKFHGEDTLYSEVHWAESVSDARAAAMAGTTASYVKIKWIKRKKSQFYLLTVRDFVLYFRCQLILIGSFLLEDKQVTPELAIILSGMLSGLICGAYGFIQGIKHGQQIAEDK